MAGSPVELSDIQRFYKDATVFLTGVTGFTGKLVLEKVLRALTVTKAYVLVRPKNDVSAAKRLQEVFESPAFDQIKRSNPEAFGKVQILEGDCSLPFLGMTEGNVELLTKTVNVIFHCAISSRFGELIREATKINVGATKDLVDMAKKMHQLRAFVYVGTAFSNCNRTEIKEEVYEPRITAENLIKACKSLDDQCLASISKTLTNGWPNTSTFTAQVAEDYINRQAKGLPICIVRPTIVTSTAAEPVSSYVENSSKLASAFLTSGMGLNRIMYYQDVDLDIVPADLVVNECIAAGWYTAQQDTSKRQNNKGEIPVFNVSSAQDNPIKQENVFLLCDRYWRQIPSPKLLEYPLYFRTTCKYNYLLLRFVFHTFVVQMVDFVAGIYGTTSRCPEYVKKWHDFQEALEPFTTKTFFIHVENTHKLLKKMSFKDRELFNFNIQTVNWEDYFIHYVRGLRFYLLEDDMDSVPEGVKRYKYLRNAMTVTLLFSTVLIYALAKLVLFRVLPLAFGVFCGFLRRVVC